MKNDPLPITRPARVSDHRAGKVRYADAFEPSAFETHTSREPERDEIKAIVLPSGEYFGVWSTRVEEMKSSALFGGFRFAAVPRARYSCPQFVASRPGGGLMQTPKPHH